MSQVSILLTPQDRHFLPSDKAISAAKSRARQYFPNCDGVRHRSWAIPAFTTTWNALEKVKCPACQAIVDVFKLKHDDEETNWWQYFENELYESSDPMNAKTVMPCCQKEVVASAIDFGKHAAFARFELSVVDPGDEYKTTDRQKAALEKILGCTLNEMMKVW